MPIIGIDDTDSSKEMCTTYITIEILRQTSLDLIGLPKLVRLNPNIPLKTRGNAAISLKLGRGFGNKRFIGVIGEREIYTYEKGQEEKLDIDIPSIIEKYSPRDEKTNPAVVISNENFNENLYYDAVRGFVDYRKIKEMIPENNYWTMNGEIGLVGASAAISWPEKITTFELISYLPREKWVGEHYVDDSSAKYIEENYPSTFDSYDLVNDYNAIRPTTKTPVLFGIRGTNYLDLLESLKNIKSEQFESFIIYNTNQGSDDHIVSRKVNEIQLYHSSKIVVDVLENPISMRGGIVKVKVGDNTGSIDAVSMEPTKNFRNIIRELRIGDRLEIYGGTTKPGIINIEKINIKSLSKEIVLEPPLCENCKIKMESSGRNGYYRCRRCGRKGEPIKREIPRKLKEGYYEVPVIARRHLARPLKLGVIV